MIDSQALKQAIGDLDEEKVLGLLKDFVALNPSEEEAQEAVSICQQGMSIVGDLYEKNEYFVGDLIFAGELLTSALNILKLLIMTGNSTNIGSIVIGTVKGDLHDIGKNIFISMAEAAGFAVYDMGIDISPSAFVEKIKEVKPEIVGLSGILTLSLDSMQKTVDLLKEVGLRDNVKIIIGGNPVTEQVCNQIGADAFTTNAVEGVKICQGWVNQHD